MKIVPFDRERHGPFVYDTFARSLSQFWPWRLMPWRPLTEELKRTLASPGTTCLVAELPEADDAFIGWLCAVPACNEVTFAYTRHAYRRRFGVMTSLLAAAMTRASLMNAPGAPIAVRFWTPAVTRLVANKGWRLYWRSTDEEEPRCSAIA